jgi:hypothetical protein
LFFWFDKKNSLNQNLPAQEQKWKLMWYPHGHMRK